MYMSTYPVEALLAQAPPRPEEEYLFLVRACLLDGGLPLLKKLLEEYHCSTYPRTPSRTGKPAAAPYTDLLEYAQDNVRAKGAEKAATIEAIRAIRAQRGELPPAKP